MNSKIWFSLALVYVSAVGLLVLAYIALGQADSDELQAKAERQTQAIQVCLAAKGTPSMLKYGEVQCDLP